MTAATSNNKTMRSPLDAAQVRKAVEALRALADAKHADQPKQTLVSDTEYVSCIITRRLIPGKASMKPIQIDIPHSLYGNENDIEMCLIVKDGDKDRIKAAIKADPVPGLTKVMAIKKLRKNFKRFEDKRALVGAYDLFLADDRILPYLKTPLGTKFFSRKKQPVAVRVSRQGVSQAVRGVFNKTNLFVNAGVCSNVRIAHLGMTDDQVVENVITGLQNSAAYIQNAWNGIQSISLKTNDSVALPIYNALASVNKLPPAEKKSSVVKRKLEEVVEPEAVSQVTPSKKKAKKNNGKAAEAKPMTPQKQQPASAEKKDKTPQKQQPASAEKKKTPQKQQPASTEKKKTPQKQQPASTEKKKTPQKQQPASTEKKKTPQKQQPASAEKKKTPQKQQPASAEKRKTPQKQQPASAEKRKTPQKQQPASSEKKSKTAKKKTS